MFGNGLIYNQVIRNKPMKMVFNFLHSWNGNIVERASRSSRRADRVMDSHITGARVQDPVGTVLSTELSTDYHHNSIIELSVR